MIRTIVIGLDIVLGVAAAVGGVYGVTSGRRAQSEWLRGTPFRSLFWPGLLLLVVCGGSLLAAAALLIADARAGRLVSVEAGVALLGWAGLMFSALGYRRWVQLLPVVLGLAVVILSFALPAHG
jgi:hypothetical protein